MSLQEHLSNFIASVSSLASHAPNDYPKGSYRSFKSDMEFLLSDWSLVVKRLGMKDEIVIEIDSDLKEMKNAFEIGDIKVGRDILWSIYNDKYKTLKKVKR